MQYLLGILRHMLLEFLGVGVRSGDDDWLLHRVCVHLERPQLVVVLSAVAEQRRAMLDVAAGRIIPLEGRVWVSGRPLARHTLADIRSRVIEADPRMSVSTGRSLVWNTLAAGPYGIGSALLRLPRARHRKAAIDALAEVDLRGQAQRPAGLLEAEERVRLALAGALARSPECMVLKDLDLAVDLGGATGLLTLLKRVARRREILVLASLASATLAGQFADRILALADGLLVFDGSPARYAERRPTLEVTRASS